MWEVLRVFLSLGLTSFGGPVAHLCYFRKELVERRNWLSEAELADTVALCQLLPGPSSSQVAICAGSYRAGLAGGLAAWVGFSLPSTILMIGCAYGLRQLPAGNWLHCLKLIAVAVVAQAVWMMAGRLCPDRCRRVLALLAALVCWMQPEFLGQLLALGLGAILGYLWYRAEGAPAGEVAGFKVARGLGPVALLAFVVLIVAAQFDRGLLASFYSVGAMVFGGGHVILPLLQSAVCKPGWVSNDNFLGGYGLAQALPGPLFSFAAYLGTLAGGWQMGLLCLFALYLPSFLLLLGIAPHWNTWRREAGWQAALKGVCAAVVGLLAATCVHPIGTGAVHSLSDGLLVLVALGLLARFPAWLVVILGGLVGWFSG